jgi:inorganic triphosphatase YgiF
MRELELKLSVDDPFVTPALHPDGVEVAGMEELPPLDLRATYYDTRDLRLARHGASLRYRTGEGDQSGWTLKLPVVDEDATSRDELHFAGPAGKVPRAASDLVTAFARSAPLEPVARLRTLRRRWCLRGADGAELAELVDDRVSITKEGRVVERFRELELEARTLDRLALERIASSLQEAGASPPRPVPKIVRALGLKATLPPDVIARDDVSPDEPAAYAVQAAIARGVQRIVANDAHARLGEVEPVHQMRVGTRRLRSDLRTFASLLDSGWVQELRSELRWLGNALGPVRDLDVMQARLRATGANVERLEPLFGQLNEQHLVARAGLLNALRSRRYVDLLEQLVTAAQSPALTPAAWTPCAEALPPLAARAWERLAPKAGAITADSGDADLHAVRILTKRTRYAAEAIGPALGPKRARAAKRFASLAADLQEVLGELQDSVIARELLEGAASARVSDGPFNLGIGRLLGREERAGEEARSEFADAWRKLARPRRRDWLTS